MAVVPSGVPSVVQGTRTQPASSTAAAAATSARSTGRSAVTVTVPVAGSTSTDSTPSMAEISSVTATWQRAQDVPVTVKVVEAVKLGAVSDGIGVLLGGGWCGVGMKSRGGARVLSPGKSPDCGSVAVTPVVAVTAALTAAGSAEPVTRTV